MINEIDILHKGHSGLFACHAGKETAGLLCIVYLYMGEVLIITLSLLSKAR